MLVTKTPVPDRVPWPKGPFMWEAFANPNNSGRWQLESGNRTLLNGYETTPETREALALALTEFPAAVAWIREHGTMQSGEQLDRYIARRDALLARVDAAGFDL